MRRTILDPETSCQYSATLTEYNQLQRKSSKSKRFNLKSKFLLEYFSRYHDHHRMSLKFSVFFLLTLPILLNASPKLQGTSTQDGVIIWRDHANANQFWYLPSRTQCELGGLLSEFSVFYFGIGKPFLEQDSEGNVRSVAGAALAGKAAIDMTGSQRASALKVIKETYNVQNPEMLPVFFENVTVQPTFAGTVLRVSDSVFPETVQLGSDFTYAVGAKNSTFAQFAAASDASGKKISNPQFSLNVSGDVEFVGDPWTADFYINLSQCWSQIRQRYSSSIKWGWFKIGSAEFNKIVSDLRRDGHIKFNITQGSLANADEANELLEIVKRQFESLNKMIPAGEGLFKFEPLPPTPDVASGGGASLFGWGVSVNGAYSASYFNQQIEYKQTITFSGRLKRRLPVSMVLAVQCSPDTEQYFLDLREPSIRCVTSQKVESLQKRLESEKELKEKLLKEYSEKLEDVKRKDQNEEKNDYPKASEEYSKIVGILENVSKEDMMRHRSLSLVELPRLFSVFPQEPRKITFVEISEDSLREEITRIAPILSK